MNATESRAAVLKDNFFHRGLLQPVQDAALATFKRLDARFRYKFFDAKDYGVGLAKWNPGRARWEMTADDTAAVFFTGPELKDYIAAWLASGRNVLLWACCLPACNTAEMKAICATVPNVSHGYCETCGPKYLQDMQAEMMMINSCRSPLELSR